MGTFAENILGRAVGHPVKAGDIVVVEPDWCMSHENASAIAGTFKKIGVQKVLYPNKIVIIFDHTVPPSTEEYALSQKKTREFVKEQGINHFYDMNCCGGICHQIMCQEGYAVPGAITVGTDSHTCTHGALGAFSTGIGRSEMAAVWATGKIWLQVPESIKIYVDGEFPVGVYAKDLILRIIGDLGADGANYKSVEFDGPGIANMSVAERMTICNMGIEFGAKNAVCRPDEKTFEFISENARIKKEPIWADDRAHYAAEYVYHLEDLVPCVAKPHTVDNFAPVMEVQGTKIDQAFMGTCTNSRIEDLRIEAGILNERHVAVRTLVIPASVKVLQQAISEGLIDIFLKAGCVLEHPGCGPCIGVSGGVLAEEETVISTANRNFKGRNGARSSKVFLASPATVAWSAVCGEIRDPREAFGPCTVQTNP